MQINLLKLLQKKKKQPKENQLNQQLENLSPNLISTRADFKQYLGLDFSLNKLSTTFLALSIFIQFILIATIVINYFQNKHIKSLISSLEPNVSFLKQNEKVTQKAFTLKAQLYQYQTVSNARVKYQDSISDIISALPSNVFLINIQSDMPNSGAYKLSVQTPSTLDAARVLASYAKVSNVSEITLNSATLTNREASTYAINFDITFKKQ